MEHEIILQGLILIPLYSGSFQRGKESNDWRPYGEDPVLNGIPLDEIGNQPNVSEGEKNTWGNMRQSNKWITIFVAVMVSVIMTLGCFLCFAEWIKHKAEGK